MTAIVTGQKTHNGVVSNSSIADATRAACYAYSSERGKFSEIFAQILKPRFGDGVDVVIGPGRPRILEETAALGIDLEEELPRSGYVFLDSLGALDGLSSEDLRVVALFDSDDFDLGLPQTTPSGSYPRNPGDFF